MKRHRILIILSVLLALGLVTVGLAAAQKMTPASGSVFAPGSISAAGSSSALAGPAAPGLSNSSGLHRMGYTGYDANWKTSFGYATSTGGVTWIKSGGNPVFAPSLPGLIMTANYAHDWVTAQTAPNTPITVTVVGKDWVTGMTDGGGEFFSLDWDWGNHHPPDIAPGDVITAAVPGTTTEINPVGSIEGLLDINTDIVSGTIDAPFGTMTLTVRCEGWEDPYPSIELTGIPADGGSYTCDFGALGWDILIGQKVGVMYIEPDGDRVMNVFEEPILNIRTNYGHDWVEGNFEAGHTMWITVTNSTGQVKATAFGETGLIPWWGDQTGFSTNANVPWLGMQPDLQAGDWVYARLDNGMTAESQLGAIDAVANVHTDIVSGTINAPWYPSTLQGNCGIWEDGGPGMGFNVDPDGGAFTCDFSGQWNIIPGTTIGVSYHEPDGDQVINMAANPAPRLNIWTWADGQPAAGSNFILNVQYRNGGDAPTQDAFITAVLEGGLTYLGDTSGMPVSGSGTPTNPFVWQAGAIPADNMDRAFYLFVHVTAAVGDWVTNTVQIENGTPYDQDKPNEKVSRWRGQVLANNTEINIGKGAWTWDPVPGSQFVYNVNICNNGSTDSAEVVVTDTLPFSTTLVSWWGQQQGWEEVISSTHQLVVSRPSFQGKRCGEVYVRVQLDANAWTGMQLHNVADVFASNDLNPDNNQAEIWHNVGFPHTNLGVNINWNWGELVPGGEIRYNLNFNNNGNLPAYGVRVTETLPVSTTFVGSYWYDEKTAHPVTPTLVTDEIVVWDIGTLDNGYGQNFEVILHVDPLAPPGLELVNTADITRLPDEDRYDDNTSAWTEMLYDHGPNLRVRKSGDWHGGDSYGKKAWYNIIVENVGDMPAMTVTVTDTLPISMVLDGDPDTDWSQVDNFVRNDAEGWFSFTFRYLHPNWRRDIQMNLFNPDPVVPGGQFFTNTAEIMQVEGEPTYADNTTEYTLASGPDLYVEKRLVGGKILPGEVVTFSLLFGNDQVKQAWWWNLQGNAWLTDTLPAGTEFITATQRWCKDHLWCPVSPEVQGDTLTWQLWPMGGGEWTEYYVTVRLTDTLTGLDTVVNHANIASDQPDLDIEPDYANNTSVYRAPVELPYFEVDKVYESNAVAGMPVVYTLTVSNIGNESGTTVEVWDWIPDWVDYGSGGSYNAGLITWTIPLIGPGSDATVWFTGTLSCSTGGIVNNQHYFVNSSDQGITSTYGTPVSFTIQIPVMEIVAEASSTDVQAGETVYFTGTATTDGTALTYAWDFGDDGSAAGQDASHAFSTPGSYLVTLTVTDTCGYTAEYSLAVEVAASTQLVYLPLVRK